MDGEKINVHVVTHTHWDREWYAPFEIFKGRLFNLIDELLEKMEKHPSFKHFMLDGQTVVLEDYLNEHPQKRDDLVKLLHEHRIIVGPWYILPDEFLVTGESMIRNFLTGQEVLKSLDAPTMRIGYLPDMFGHNAYTPSVLKDLDLKAAVVWRGVGDACRDTEFIWKSPNGDEILTVNLLHGYGNGAHFGRSISEMRKVFSKEIEFLSNHKTTNNVLIMNGTDHEFPMYELVEKFSSWEKEMKVNLTHSTIENYVDAVIRENPSLKEIQGELKDPKYEPVLKDVTSTRIYLKLLNFEAQYLFTRYVEPLSAYIWMNGEKVDLEEIKKGWKLILKSQPHDSICGCSVDVVHKDVESRLRSSIELGSSLVAKYMRRISKGLDRDEDMGIPILVFNPYEHERNSVVSVEVNVSTDNSYEVVDENGEKLESFIKTSEKAGLLNESKENDYLKSLTTLSEFQSAPTPWNLFFRNPKILNFRAVLPPVGFKIFYLRENKSGKKTNEKTENPDFENDFYAFHLNDDGSFDLKDKMRGTLYESLNYFEDVADAGDEYNFSPIKNDTPITTLKQRANIISIEDHGFLKEVKVELKMKLPKSLDTLRKYRTKEKDTVEFYILYKLYRDLPRIDVELFLNNNVMDHKLSFVTKLPERIEEVKNDGYFGMISHPADFRIYNDYYTEEHISRYAMESFASFNGKKSKLAVITRGIHEYESHVSEEETKVNFTLLRSVGWLSREDLLTRKGHAGPPIPTPDGQCIGKYRYRYSFALLDNDDESDAYEKSRDFLLEPVAMEIEKVQGKKETFKITKFNFDKDAFLSAFKISQDGHSIVLRWVNHSNSESKVRIESPFDFEIVDSNMAEKEGKRIAFGKEIVLKSAKSKTTNTTSIRLKR